MPSQIAIRKLLKWLAFCKSIGWSAESTPRLADLWWEYHDAETGEPL